MRNAMLLLLLLCTLQAYGIKRDTGLVYFPLDKTNFVEASGRYLDSLISNKVLLMGRPIILLGYGDYLGSEEYNKNLSYIRAKNVQDYLVLAGFNKSDITVVIGKGKINRNATNGKLGSPPDRKVEIIYEPRIDTPEDEKLTYYLFRMQVNETLPLSNIQFYRGSIRMIPESMVQLQALIQFMKEHTSYAIQLEGHVCCLGLVPDRDEPYDESTLSTKRAQCIYDSLVNHGINKARLKYIGLGNNNPIADPEVTDEDMRLNRRVEVRVLSK
jgi:outer membrane protein OmpA-like peptidoglycan-associated protein